MIRYVVSLFFIYSFVCVSSFVHITVVSNLLSYKKTSYRSYCFLRFIESVFVAFFWPNRKGIAVKIITRVRRKRKKCHKRREMPLRWIDS